MRPANTRRSFFGRAQANSKWVKRVLAADPRNPLVLKNLDAILGKEGDSLKALYYLRQSFEIDPQDPQTVYGLVFACTKLGDIDQAQKHFQMVLEMEAPEELRGLARNGLRGELRSVGSRPGGRGWTRSSICRMRFGCSARSRWRRSGRYHSRSGCWERYGLDINDPEETHVLGALPGRTLSAPELVCIMYAGFKQFEPGMDIEVDLAVEWGMAES